jgi:small subunit ribosomal protein S6
MPQYELMYLLGSNIADTEVPNITAQILKFIEDFGGTNIVETQLGKKKLAYPIKKTRNGHYVVVTFNMETNKINEFDAKIRTQDSSIIRYIIVNQEEHLKRDKKDKIIQAQMPRKAPAVQTAAQPSTEIQLKKEKEPAKEPMILEINQEELDKRIEEALSEDLTK